MKNIIIDCDPGHDDAMAICLALAYKEELNIVGITTVGGNQSIDKVTDNTLKIVELLNEDIEVSKGAPGPLTRELRVAPEAHGVTGMDGPILKTPKREVVPEFAVQYIAGKLRESKEKMTIVAIGPLTNIALLVRTYPDLLDKIEEISIMGGGISVGNITPAAEFNIYVDPEAAKIVFDSGVPIVMSGLDVTDNAYLLKEEYQMLENGGVASKFVSDLLMFYSIYGEEHGYTGSAIHDACAIMYLIKPELFESKMYQVDVSTSEGITRGMTVADTRKQSAGISNAKVLLDVNREKFRDVLLGSFKILDRRLEGSCN